MTQMPVMPVLVERLLGDTDHLSNEEFGAYLRLLLAGWSRDAVLSKEDMPRLARAGAGRWPRLWSRLAPFFTRVDGNSYTQKRLRKSLDDARHNAQANRVRAEKARAGLARKNKGALNNDRASTGPVTETVKAAVTSAVTERMPLPKSSVTRAVTGQQPEPEKDKALLPSSREPYPSAPIADAAAPPPREAEGSAAVGSPGLEGRSPPQPSERVPAPTPALLRSKLVKNGGKHDPEPPDDPDRGGGDDDQGELPEPSRARRGDAGAVGLFGALEAAIRRGKGGEGET